jgi:large subunit ribosomal protein L23
MALFGTKKNTKAKATKSETTEVAVVSSTARDLSHIIKSPRITEKASMKAEANIYAFEVAQVATKSSIAAAIKEMYNVTPLKVAIVRIPKKEVFVRGKAGTKGGGKKAYIFLKKGETIEFA